MREIKFRAWDKQFGGWLDYICLTLGGETHYQTEMGKFGVPTPNVVLMQYTGLKDKNGKGIYENDYLKTDRGIICKVYWSASGASFMISYPNIWQNRIGRLIYKKLMNWHAKSEVIGNIYENPELLEEK